jgi:hypothetical protein
MRATAIGWILLGIGCAAPATTAGGTTDAETTSVAASEIPAACDDFEASDLSLECVEALHAICGAATDEQACGSIALPSTDGSQWHCAMVRVMDFPSAATGCDAAAPVEACHAFELDDDAGTDPCPDFGSQETLYHLATSDDRVHIIRPPASDDGPLQPIGYARCSSADGGPSTAPPACQCARVPICEQ